MSNQFDHLCPGPDTPLTKGHVLVRMEMYMRSRYENKMMYKCVNSMLHLLISLKLLKKEQTEAVFCNVG